MKQILLFLRGNAIALLALGIALGGTSYAAITLPKNSVKAKQIAPNAVRSNHVKDGTLLRRDFKPGQFPAACHATWCFVAVRRRGWAS